ncbi:MAG: hypothetical protein QOG25_1394 [Acetobacteraceae bacterium]|jgi:hypothetical protein|nr:hypothetical protein [Acetobacteraceae bacterium]
MGYRDAVFLICVDPWAPRFIRYSRRILNVLGGNDGRDALVQRLRSDRMFVLIQTASHLFSRIISDNWLPPACSA